MPGGCFGGGALQMRIGIDEAFVNERAVFFGPFRFFGENAHHVDAHIDVPGTRSLTELIEIELADAIESPKQLNLLRGRSVLERSREFFGAVSAERIDICIHGQQPPRETWRTHFFNQAFELRAFERERAQSFLVDQAPDAPAFAIPTWMIHSLFIV